MAVDYSRSKFQIPYVWKMCCDYDLHNNAMKWQNNKAGYTLHKIQIKIHLKTIYSIAIIFYYIFLHFHRDIQSIRIVSITFRIIYR